MATKKPAGLTVVALKALEPGPKTYEVKDDAVTGGYVQVWPSGNLSYLVRYRFRNKSKKLVIGRLEPDSNGFASARKKAREAQNQLLEARSRPDGVDPVSAKRKAKSKLLHEREMSRASELPAPSPTDLVENVVADFIELWAKPHNKDWRETERILNKEIVGRWARRRLSEISSAEVRQALREITERAPIGANRAFARFRRLCNWALEQEIISVSPVEKIRAFTPEKGRARERALNDHELALIWQASNSLGYSFGPMMQLLILTGQRRGEVAGMTWVEVDLEAEVWTIPAARSKNGRAHQVPLTEPVISILRRQPRFTRPRGGVDFVFSPGLTAPSGFSRARRRRDEAILAVGATGGNPSSVPFPDWVLHDIRRSVASGMARLGVSLPVIERCLNHLSGSFGGIVGVYQRHSFADEMRDAFTRWASHISELAG